MLPTNAALLTTVPEQCQWVAEKVLKGNQTLAENLLDISTYWKVKVWFTKPVSVYHTRFFLSDLKESNTHVFNRFGVSQRNSTLIYLFKRNGRYGKPFDFKNLIEKYEIVFSHHREFTFEQFKSKFDPRFITDAELQRLWSMPSSQTGNKYARSDFKQIGPEGKRVLARFLTKFNMAADGATPHYHSYNGTYFLSERYSAMDNRHFSRDIKIEHKAGSEYIFYSSEFPGCGNGSYGILANEKQWLHLEDD